VSRSLWEKSGHGQIFKEGHVSPPSRKTRLCHQAYELPMPHPGVQTSLKSHKDLPLAPAEFGSATATKRSGAIARV